MLSKRIPTTGPTDLLPPVCFVTFSDEVKAETEMSDIDLTRVAEVSWFQLNGEPEQVFKREHLR